MNDAVLSSKGFDAQPPETWKILIVDDDPGIHAITRTVLRDLVYDDRNLELISANSRVEAEEILRTQDDIAIILLDVVMEEDDSGLRLIHFVRKELGNQLVRIILRTGQPGNAPSNKVISEYDINDYEEKTDLTAQRLYTTVITSLRNYNDLRSLEANRVSLEHHRTGLAKNIEASAKLYGAKDPEQFTRIAHAFLLTLVGGEGSSSFAALQDQSDFRIIATTGSFAGIEGSAPREVIGEKMFESLRKNHQENKSLLLQDRVIQLYEDARRFRMLLHIVSPGRLKIQDRQLLDVFASNVSLTFENLRLNREIIGTQEDLIVRLSEAVETRSHETAQHVRRVGELCESLARRYGLSNSHSRELRLASALHDLGKIGISDEILLKPDILTDEEFEMMKSHTQVGYEMLKSSHRSLLRTASVICRQHHERFDGYGYPDGIARENIHINARIVAICDVFDSLSHGRLHRDRWEIDQVVDYLSKERGKAFDPHLIDLFLSDIDAAVRINDEYPD